MSTILKALRRLEEERSFEQSHSLREHVVGGFGEEPREPSRFKVLAIVAGGLLSAAAAGGWVFAPWNSVSTQAPTVAAAPPARVAAFSGVPIDDPPTAVRQSPPPSVAPSRANASRAAAAEPVVTARRVAAPVPESAASSALPPEAKPSPEPSLHFAKDVAIVLRGEERLPTIEDKPRPIEPPSALAVQIDEPLRVIRRAEVPGVEVVQTIWHPQPARREAVLRIPDHDELVRVAEGDAVGTLVLLEIQPAGVVFAHEGLQIQRRVGDRSHL